MTHKGRRRLPFAFLFAIAVIWSPALAGPFQFDDYNVIVNFAPVHSLGAWAQAMPGIRPLLKLTYALNWTLSPSPFGFHLFNLLVHLLNGLLLLGWARRVLPLGSSAALLLMALWLLHPVQTEAVTYIAGRSVSLSTTFLLAGLLAQAHARRGAAWFAALCTLLALAVRETAWIFPVVFVLVAWLRGIALRTALREALPSAAVVALAAMVFLLEPHYRHMVDVSFSLRDTAAQWRTQISAHAYLLGQLAGLAPNIDPDVRTPPVWNGVLVLQGLALAGALGVALYCTLARRSWIAAGVLWYFLMLLPTNSFMPRVDAVSDRHLYVALAGPLWSLLLLLQGWRSSRAVAALAMVALALATVVRNEDYRSETALWGRTAVQSPGKARVWNNLGMACRETGQEECAVEAFRRAMELDPADSRPAVNLYFLQRQ